MNESIFVFLAREVAYKFKDLKYKGYKEKVEDIRYEIARHLMKIQDEFDDHEISLDDVLQHFKEIKNLLGCVLEIREKVRWKSGKNKKNLSSLYLGFQNALNEKDQEKMLKGALDVLKEQKHYVGKLSFWDYYLVGKVEDLLDALERHRKRNKGQIIFNPKKQQNNKQIGNNDDIYDIRDKITGILDKIKKEFDDNDTTKNDTTKIDKVIKGLKDIGLQLRIVLRTRKRKSSEPEISEKYTLRGLYNIFEDALSDQGKLTCIGKSLIALSGLNRKHPISSTSFWNRNLVKKSKDILGTFRTYIQNLKEFEEQKAEKQAEEQKAIAQKDQNNKNGDIQAKCLKVIKNALGNNLRNKKSLTFHELTLIILKIIRHLDKDTLKNFKNKFTDKKSDLKNLKEMFRGVYNLPSNEDRYDVIYEDFARSLISKTSEDSEKFKMPFYNDENIKINLNLNIIDDFIKKYKSTS